MAVESLTRISTSSGTIGAELGQHRARLRHRARPVGLQLVPVRRQAEHRPRVAGAQGADDQVVDPLGVLEDDEAGVVVEADAELLAGGAAVGEQPRLERRIDPGPRHDLGAERRRARIEDLDLAADLVRPDQPLLDQQLADGRLHDLVVAGRPGLAGPGRGVPVVMVVIMPVRMHRLRSSPARSRTPRSAVRRCGGPRIVRPDLGHRQGDAVVVAPAAGVAAVGLFLVVDARRLDHGLDRARLAAQVDRHAVVADRRAGRGSGPGRPVRRPGPRPGPGRRALPLPSTSSSTCPTGQTPS